MPGTTEFEVRWLWTIFETRVLKRRGRQGFLSDRDKSTVWRGLGFSSQTGWVIPNYAEQACCRISIFIGRCLESRYPEKHSVRHIIPRNRKEQRFGNLLTIQIFFGFCEGSICGRPCARNRKRGYRFGLFQVCRLYH